MKNCWWPLCLACSVYLSITNPLFAQRATIRGSGATFPEPLYSQWAEIYNEAHSDVEIIYKQVASLNGIEQLRKREVDFAGTDWPISNEEASRFSGPVIHIATVAGAVVPIYHLNRFNGPLYLSPEVLAGIFSGTIKKWDDRRIAEDNKSNRYFDRRKLKSREIHVVHRSDGSGTTFIFTKFLETSAKSWKLGSGFFVKWPVGKGVDRNSGVAEAVEQNDGSIGYVEYVYAFRRELDYAYVKNRANEFVHADIGKINRAIQSGEFIGPLKAAALEDAPQLAPLVFTAKDPHAYPISAFTWLLIPQAMERERGRALSNFVCWALGPGQRIVTGLFYAPLPIEMIRWQLEGMKRIPSLRGGECLSSAPNTLKENPNDGQPYVWVASGTFQMGCSLDDSECDNDERPAHNVTITNGFWLGETPVPQAAYEYVMHANPSHFRGDQLPVENVTWYEARDYCTAVGMRLPTEAEWEFAARAGTTTSRYGEPNNIAWYKENSDGQTHKIREKESNAWGLYDMLGNVREWVGDEYQASYYQNSPLENPKGPTSSSEQYRVVRGAAWVSRHRAVRLSKRDRFEPEIRNDSTGFRCAGDGTPSEPPASK